jgi:hypothetical protein
MGFDREEQRITRFKKLHLIYFSRLWNFLRHLLHIQLQSDVNTIVCPAISNVPKIITSMDAPKIHLFVLVVGDGHGQ